MVLFSGHVMPTQIIGLQWNVSSHGQKAPIWEEHQAGSMPVRAALMLVFAFNCNTLPEATTKCVSASASKESTRNTPSIAPPLLRGQCGMPFKVGVGVRVSRIGLDLTRVLQVIRAGARCHVLAG